MSITAVDNVCTDAQLANAYGGQERFQGLLESGQTSAQVHRQDVFDRVLSHLKGRTPPIRETDLQDPAELRQAVAYGTLAEMCMAAATEEGDIWHTRYKHFKGLYNAELTGLRPTVSQGQTGGPRTLPLSRR